MGHEEPSPLAADHSRQKVWDTPRVKATFKAIQAAAPDARARAHLLVVCRKESGAWLHALPVSSLGLRIDDEVMRVVMGLRLGASLCHLHECHLCGAGVDHQGTHSLPGQRSLGHHSRHIAINDLIKRSLATGKIDLKAAGICRADRKRLYGATVRPWKGGRVLVWDAICPVTPLPLHICSWPPEKQVL